MTTIANFASILFCLAVVAQTPAQQQQPQQPPRRGPAGASRELMLVDDNGVIRWRSNNTEISLSGGNYALPSGGDFRAVGALGADIKKVIDQDMYHLIRIGWNALRIPFAGDWECSDKNGNLIDNAQLDALDYLIKSAGDRDQHIILTPVVGYGYSIAGAPTGTGFAGQYKKEELTTNPAAIAAQANFIKQLLNHVNRYNNLAYNRDTRICLLELVHEPSYPASDEATIQYINTLMDAIHEIGCTKPTFFNAGPDFGKMKAVAASKADGISFAWNPTGTSAAHELRGNYLRTVDAFPPALAEVLPKKPRIVYDFDMAGVTTGDHLAAMVRTFRSMGVQYSTMSDYDSLATAPYNLTSPATYLNVIYTPQKAVASNVALQVGRQYPMNQPHGDYPQNTKFGEFHISYEDNLSERVNNLMFIYSNDTKTMPDSLQTLTKITGFGSSPIVQYEGLGAYFFDKMANGAWRLEVYPDAIQIADPFAGPSRGRTVTRLIWHAWPMTIALPELGQSFKVEPQNEGNTYTTQASGGKFTISPGTYLLTSAELTAPPRVPDRLQGVPYRLGLKEFFCPPTDQLPTSVLVRNGMEFVSGQLIAIHATVADKTDPSAVTLQIRKAGDASFKSFPMKRTKSYDYRTSVPAGTFGEGTLQFQIGVMIDNATRTFPAMETAPFLATVVSPSSPLALFDAATDHDMLDASTNIAGAKSLNLVAVPSVSNMAAVQFIGDRIAARGEQITRAKSIRVKLRGIAPSATQYITLILKDGSAWSAAVAIKPQLSEVVIPLADLKPGKWTANPAGPGGPSPIWIESTKGAAIMDLRQVERIQFSLRRDETSRETAAASVQIDGALLEF